MESAPEVPLGLYNALSDIPAEIRLLTLLRGKNAQPIHCRLEVVLLDSAPEYEALSYVWGNPDVTKPIQVNDRLAEVTTNLEAALRHLRIEDSDRTLWVDAVCINQGSPAERGKQVSIMGRIYSTAKQVVVWLGKEESVPSGAVRPFSFVQRQLLPLKQLTASVRQNIPGDISRSTFDGLYSENEDEVLQQPDLTGDVTLLAFTVLYLLSQDMHTLALEKAGTAEEDSFRRTIFSALLEVFERAWWSRMWVVQEIVLAQEVTVMYGQISAPWEMFARAGLSIERHRNSCCAATPTGRIQILSNTLSRISEEILEIEQSQLLRRGDDEVASFFKQYSTDGVAPRGGIIRKDRTKLTAYIWHTRHRAATDPRDKIYGVLGLVPDWLDTEPIVPDYTKSSYHMFRNTVLKMIRGDNNFDILCEVQSPWSRHPDLASFIASHKSPSTVSLQKMIDHSRSFGPYLPSWVPDFTAPSPFHQADRPAKLLLVNAMSISKVPVEIHDNFILSAKALTIDFVIDMGPILFLAPGENSDAKGILTETLSAANVFKDWSSMAKTMKYFMPDSYPLGTGSFEHAFLHTICGGVKWFRHPHGNRRPIMILEMGMGDGAFNGLEDNDFETYKSWEDWVLNHSHISLPEYCRQQHVDESEVRGLNKAIISNCLGKRFFVTRKGYFGIGPPGMQRGDVVHVPVGSRTPFILRKGGEAKLSGKGLQKCHTVVGDCYVQGIMRGEINKSYEEIRAAQERGEKDIDLSAVRRFELGTVFLQ